MKTSKEVSRLKRLADRADIVDLVSKLVRELALDLPCTVTIEDGSLHLIVTAERGGPTYEKDTPDEAFLINFKV